MKKILAIAALCAIMATPSQAQIGGLLRQAASKTVEKTTNTLLNKATDKASDKAVESIEGALGAKAKTTTGQTVNLATASLADILGQSAVMPTDKEIVEYKGYELNNQQLRLLASPVSRYLGSLSTNSMKAMGMIYGEGDSAAMTNMAMQYTSMATGLSQEQIREISEMSEEEQEAYLTNYYNSGQMQANQLKRAETSAEYATETEKQLNQYNAIEDRIAGIYDEARSKMQTVYGKYAEQLASAKTDAQRNAVLLKYYAEAVPLQRDAVQKSMELRRTEQLPLAEEMDAINNKILTEHPDAIVVTTYVNLLVTQYYIEGRNIIDIPEF